MDVAPFFMGDDGGSCISCFVLRAPLCRVSETGAIRGASPAEPDEFVM
jgi:hypothetical protein